jgi:hypothetical protein
LECEQQYKVPELSMKYALLAQPHIKAQRSRLEELIESRGRVVLRHARYWPALLNFIEMMFVRSKRLTRAWNNHKVARLEDVLPVSMGMGGIGGHGGLRAMLRARPAISQKG